MNGISEKAAIGGGKQRCDVTGQIGGKRPRYGGIGSTCDGPDAAQQPVNPIGLQRDPRGEIVDHPDAAQGQRQRRLASNTQHHRRNAASPFAQRQVQRQLAAGFGIAAGKAERACGTIDPRHRQLRRPFAIRQLQRPIQRQDNGSAQHIRAQFDPGGADLADGNRNRQHRQRKAARLGRGQGTGNLRPARQDDPVGRQRRHFDPPAQQGRPVPVQCHTAQGQPDARVIGNGQLAQAGAR